MLIRRSNSTPQISPNETASEPPPMPRTIPSATTSPTPSTPLSTSPDPSSRSTTSSHSSNTPQQALRRPVQSNTASASCSVSSPWKSCFTTTTASPSPKEVQSGQTTHPHNCLFFPISTCTSSGSSSSSHGGSSVSGLSWTASTHQRTCSAACPTTPQPSLSGVAGTGVTTAGSCATSTYPWAASRQKI